MKNRHRAVKGTRDLFPPESERFAGAEEAARRVFGSYGYGEVRTPCLESTELFARSVGETIRPVQVDGDRRGYVIAFGETNLEALERAEAAARLLDVEVS